MVKEHVEDLRDLSELLLDFVLGQDSNRQHHARGDAKCVVLTNIQEIVAPRDACRSSNVLASTAASLDVWRASAQRRRILVEVADG